MELKTQILKALGLSEDQKVSLEYQAKLEDGTIIVSTADSLTAGIDISILTEDGTTIPLPVGEYKTEDGQSFSVSEEGVVAEIIEETEETEETEEVEAGMDPDKKKYEEVTSEVAEVITDEVAQAKGEIAEAINDATGDEVTADVAEAAAEIAVAIVEEKVEDIALNKQINTLIDVMRDELTVMRNKITELENTPGGEPVKANKFSSSKGMTELSKKEYAKLTARDKFFYNINK